MTSTATHAPTTAPTTEPTIGATPALLRVSRVLGQHRYRDVLGDYETAPYYKHFGCSCGWEQDIAGMSGWRSWFAAHEAHVAEAVLADLGARTSEAWGIQFNNGNVFETGSQESSLALALVQMGAAVRSVRTDIPRINSDWEPIAPPAEETARG